MSFDPVEAPYTTNYEYPENQVEVIHPLGSWNNCAAV